MFSAENFFLVEGCSVLTRVGSQNTALRFSIYSDQCKRMEIWGFNLANSIEIQFLGPKFVDVFRPTKVDLGLSH